MGGGRGKGRRAAGKLRVRSGQQRSHAWGQEPADGAAAALGAGSQDQAALHQLPPRKHHTRRLARGPAAADFMLPTSAAPDTGWHGAARRASWQHTVQTAAHQKAGQRPCPGLGTWMLASTRMVPQASPFCGMMAIKCGGQSDGLGGACCVGRGGAWMVLLCRRSEGQACEWCSSSVLCSM